MCQSCNVANINGINCHETGCPESVADYAKRKGCTWCGGSIPQASEAFSITDSGAFCDDGCRDSYHN